MRVWVKVDLVVVVGIILLHYVFPNVFKFNSYLRKLGLWLLFEKKLYNFNTPNKVMIK